MADNKDLNKSVEETVSKILAADQAAVPATDVAKAMPSSSPANGGEDKIHSGSPMTEEQKAEEAKKAAAAAKEKEDKEKEDEAKKAMADKDADDKKKKDEEDAKKAKSSKMKKSIEELSAHLDPEELELVKAWREESEKEVVAKSQDASPATSAQDLGEILKKAIAEGTADLRKAFEEKDTLIKSLSDKIEKMASQPAYDRRSISTLEAIEKSGSEPAQLTKSQVLDKMLALQAAGKGVTSHHIAEFEATRNISDPTVRGIVFKELKLN